MTPSQVLPYLHPLKDFQGMRGGNTRKVDPEKQGGLITDPRVDTSKTLLEIAEECEAAEKSKEQRMAKRERRRERRRRKRENS